MDVYWLSLVVSLVLLSSILQISLIRHFHGINKAAGMRMDAKYDKDLMGKVALQLFKHHRHAGICYEHDEEASMRYESIIDKYNEQFNMKYGSE